MPIDLPSDPKPYPIKLPRHVPLPSLPADVTDFQRHCPLRHFPIGSGRRLNWITKKMRVPNLTEANPLLKGKSR
jgi:hypothetical protein